MDDFRRFALYHAPGGALADFGAAWLGWDAVGGCAVTHPEVPGLPRPLDAITEAPRRYGLHATIKPPFRLAPGCSVADLQDAAAALCAARGPVSLPGLALNRLGGFLALTPAGDSPALSRLAAEMVAGLDRFRAPPTAEEIARRRPDRLNAQERRNLADWGYPYVMDAFRFHITLTGPLPEAEAERVRDILAPQIAPYLPAPYAVDALGLFGEGADGRFRLIHRYDLTGAG